MEADVSSGSSSNSLWCVDTLWWPVEVIPLQVVIVEPRKLTALEWALLRVVDAFGSAVPGLDEVAEELGLDDPVFLEETLDEVVSLNALEPAEGEEWSGLEDLRFTDDGARLYRKGQIEAAPATYGVTFYVDAITDEDLQDPAGLRDRVESGFLANQFERARETLGLDRVRSLLQRTRRDLLKGDAELREVLCASEARALPRSDVRWRPVNVVYVIGDDGQLTFEPDGLSAKAAHFLLSRDAIEDCILPEDPITGRWPPTETEVAVTGVDFSQWRNGVLEVLPAAEVCARAIKSVQRARSEIVLHAFWLGADKLERELRNAVARGVRVLVAGLDDADLEWSGPTSFLLKTSLEDALPCGLIVDAHGGLVLDEVTALVAGAEVSIEVVGALTEDAAKDIRLTIVRASLASVPASHLGALVKPLPSDNYRTVCLSGSAVGG